MSQSDEKPGKVSQAQAEDAVRVLLEWAGEDPTREGLLDTPKRVAKAYRDWFSGYQMDPREYLARTFEEVAGYDEMIGAMWCSQWLSNSMSRSTIISS